LRLAFKLRLLEYYSCPDRKLLWNSDPSEQRLKARVILSYVTLRECGPDRGHSRVALLDSCFPPFESFLWQTRCVVEMRDYRKLADWIRGTLWIIAIAYAVWHLSH
jgi:hypothetical protein